MEGLFLYTNVFCMVHWINQALERIVKLLFINNHQNGLLVIISQLNIFTTGKFKYTIRNLTAHSSLELSFETFHGLNLRK